MSDREQRRAEAAKHNGLMKGVFASETQACVDATIIYEDGEGRELDLPEAPYETTETDVTTLFPAAVMYKAQGKVAIVDPASFSRPGGNYEDGGFGPEQALCADSNLYQILCGLKEAYYDQNRGFARGLLFTDRAMFIDNVTFNRNGSIKKCAIIAITEPVREKALENHRSERECDTCIAQRIETLLRIAAYHEIETLICGAFGCGRQGYDPQQIIELFQTWIAKHPGAIKKIVFAVPRQYFEAFEVAFGTPKTVEAPVVEQDSEEEELPFDPHDLPEGVTFVSASAE